MNREMLKQNGVRLRGVILNKVNPKKMDMIKVQLVVLLLRMLDRYTSLEQRLIRAVGCRTITREH